MVKMTVRRTMILFPLLFFTILDCIIASKLNFLFIIIDDLRPALGCYDDTNAFTPNMDRLAKTGTLFTQAYSQQALCAPSRNSLLTSRRPDTLLLYDVHSYWRSSTANFTTLPQHLKNHGYETKSIGKVFHPGISSNFTDDCPYSWSQVPFHPITDKYKNAPVCSSFKRINSTNIRSRQSNLVCPVSVARMPERILPDIENLEAAKIFLENQSLEKPFFLAVGFEKPHIPFKFPKKFLTYHPIKKFKLKNYHWPGNISEVAYNPWNDLRIRHDIKQLNLKFPWDKIPDYFAKKIIQSYYASVSYVDHLIGLLLNQLNRLQLDDKTIIVLTSDHGWSLGEHGVWAKYSNFDVAARVPLIVSFPPRELKMPAALSKVNSLVELVDLFPTIAELASFSIPLCEDKKFSTIKFKKNNSDDNILCSEGISFLPLLQSKLYSGNITLWKKASFSQYPRPSLHISRHPNSDQPRLSEIKIMGYTLKTIRYRYTAWIPFNYKNKNKIKSNWHILLAEELYDQYYDPDEMINQQGNSFYYKTKKKLFKLLKKGWRAALPQHYY